MLIAHKTRIHGFKFLNFKFPTKYNMTLFSKLDVCVDPVPINVLEKTEGDTNNEQSRDLGTQDTGRRQTKHNTI